ncbi:hypothetical protein FB451DRAFT_1564794 [Mycena latifolia]|nr:hypothetical protein FB451DRAFT_1564794 [Mycena latifolia]
MVPYLRIVAIISLSLPVLRAAALPACPDVSESEFDFVVVGAGVGGGPIATRLAESGYSVLVVDAGHDVISVNTTIPFHFGRAVEDPQLELNYTLDEFSHGAKFPRNDVWYPRARGLGGSTVHNALVNNVADTKGDFDNLAKMFNDSTWSYNNMRNYFKRIEHNLYLAESDPDHGFHDAQLLDIVDTLVASGGPTIGDINSPANDLAVGLGVPSYTLDEHGNRSSVRDYLASAKGTGDGNLRFAFDTLATKVVMCDPGAGRSPATYGVEISRGAALAVASNFEGKTDLQTELVTVQHEVIISAGVFQSPQLLMLSGIGDHDELSQLRIEPVVHLPGVGANLQDHDEIANIWTLKQNHTLFNGCTVLFSPEDDPCLDHWIDAPSLLEPDIMIYWTPGYFPGFIRGFPNELANVHNALTAIVLKAHSSSRGVVRLTGNHPQDPLQIEKRHFEAPGGQQDVVDLREAIKAARSLGAHPTITLHMDAQVFPSPDNGTDGEIEDHILQHIFGHHACCTIPMGPDDDPNAVLDGNFRVRGVDNLRVVDISSWPNVPGWFVTTPTYMVRDNSFSLIFAIAS